MTTQYVITFPEKPPVHISHIPVRWGEMDAMGHVNNTVYFRYMEQTRIDWLHSVGLHEKKNIGLCNQALTTGLVIINTHCTFLQQLRYPDEIEVHLFISHIGKTSFDTLYNIVRKPRHSQKTDTRKSAAQGQAKVVWVDMQKEKAIPLPEKILTLLQK